MPCCIDYTHFILYDYYFFLIEFLISKNQVMNDCIIENKISVRAR